MKAQLTLLLLYFCILRALCSDCPDTYSRVYGDSRWGSGIDTVLIRSYWGKIIVQAQSSPSVDMVEVVVRTWGTSALAVDEASQYDLKINGSSFSFIMCDTKNVNNCSIQQRECPDAYSGESDSADISTSLTPSVAMAIGSVLISYGIDGYKSALLAATTASIMFIPTVSATSASSCVDATVTVTLPQSWAGSVIIESTTAPIEIKGSFALGKMIIRTTSASVTVSASSYLAVRELEVSVDDGIFFTPTLTLSGSSTASFRTVSGMITISEMAIPSTQSEISVNACNGRIDISSLQNFNGKFTASTYSGNVVIQGSSVHWSHKDKQSMSGTIGSSAGANNLTAISQSGQITVTCKS